MVFSHYFPRAKKPLSLLLLVLMLQGCVLTGPSSSVQILGTWESIISGISTTSTFSEGMVSLDSHPALPYVLEGDELVVNGDRNTRRMVSFPSDDVMLQVNPITGTEHIYSRSL